MPSVFISYRRSDADAAAQFLAQRLKAALGADRVFIDTDIPAGVDFRQHLGAKLAAADRVLVLMGDRWLNATDADGRRRLDAPNDALRFEVETALITGTILPILVGDVRMPAEGDLPASVRAVHEQRAAAALRP